MTPLDPKKLTMQQVEASLRSALNPDSEGANYARRLATLHWLKKAGYEEVCLPACTITIEPRPVYCDRGNWIVKVFAPNCLIDAQDAFPRYYFDLGRAKLEMLDWVNKRGLGSGACGSQASVEAAVPQEASPSEDPECRAENFHHDLPMVIDDY